MPLRFDSRSRVKPVDKRCSERRRRRSAQATVIPYSRVTTDWPSRHRRGVRDGGWIPTYDRRVRAEFADALSAGGPMQELVDLVHSAVGTANGVDLRLAVRGGQAAWHAVSRARPLP